MSYFKEFWRYYILNELSIKKINELHEQNQRLSDLASSVDVPSFLTILQLLQQEMQMALSQRYKKKNRRTSQEIEKTYQCPYEKCNKLYGSDVSLNLHIKLKHQGGNKTDREKVAVTPSPLIPLETHRPGPGARRRRPQRQNQHPVPARLPRRTPLPSLSSSNSRSSGSRTSHTASSPKPTSAAATPSSTRTDPQLYHFSINFKYVSLPPYQFYYP